MNKRKLIEALCVQARQTLEVLTQAAYAARDAANHPESKAEDQYDTRGLEASYLAGAQSKRAAELESLITLYTHIDLKAFGPKTPIASTALVQTESDGKTAFYLLMPEGGGLSTQFEGQSVQVITPQSPLGTALLGCVVGDCVSVPVQRQARDYEIIGVS